MSSSPVLPATAATAPAGFNYGGSLMSAASGRVRPAFAAFRDTVNGYLDAGNRWHTAVDLLRDASGRQPTAAIISEGKLPHFADVAEQLEAMYRARAAEIAAECERLGAARNAALGEFVNHQRRIMPAACALAAALRTAGGRAELADRLIEFAAGCGLFDPRAAADLHARSCEWRALCPQLEIEVGDIENKAVKAVATPRAAAQAIGPPQTQAQADEPVPPTAKPDGPYASGCFRVGPVDVTGIGPRRRWPLISAVWGEPPAAVSAADVWSKVYPAKEFKRDKLGELMRDATEQLRKGCGGHPGWDIAIEFTAQGSDYVMLKITRPPDSLVRG